MLHSPEVWQQGLFLRGQHNLRVDGKQISRGAVNSVDPASPASLAHAVDKLSGMKILIDTSAAYSVIPHSSSAPACGLPLRGAGGSVIRCWGPVTITVKFGAHQFKRPFLRAAVGFPLLGEDFLKTNKLVVDLDGGSVLVKGSKLKIPTSPADCAAIFASVSSPPDSASPAASPSPTPSSSSVNRCNVPRSRRPIAQLLAEFPEVCNASKQLPPAKHSVLHEIETRGGQ